MKNNNCVIAARLATSSWSRKAPACHPEPIRQAQGKLRAKRVVEGSIVAIFLAMFLTACGDSDGASANNGSATLEDVYASEDDLPGCTEKYDGAVAFVKEGSTAFKCEDGRWENKGEYYANNDAIKNCTAKREGEVAYIVDEDKSLVCQDGKWVNSSNVSSSSSWSEAIGSCSSKVPEPAEGTSSSDVSSSSVESSSSSSVTPQSCSGETSVSSNSTKSSSSVVPSSSSVASSSSVQSSSSIVVAMPCKTDEEDNCEYGILKDSRDGQEYRTVKIGDQVWMAENLNYAYTDVPFDNRGYTSDSTSWCLDNDPANCAKYGRFYTWTAAMDSVGEWSTNGKGCGYGKTCSVASAGSTTLVRGICPEGWHLPREAECKVLFTATVEGSSMAGLKSATGWSSSGNGTDTFGFSALPAGWSYHGGYSREGDNAYFWSSTEYKSNNAYGMGLSYDIYYVNVELSKDYGFSVRCVKD